MLHVGRTRQIKCYKKAKKYIYLCAGFLGVLSHQ